MIRKAVLEQMKIRGRLKKRRLRVAGDFEIETSGSGLMQFWTLLEAFATPLKPFSY